MKVTARQLRNKGASLDHALIFAGEWPEGVEITLEVLERAVELKLDLHCFACSFLPASAWRAYSKATAPARETYMKAMTSLKAYDKAITSILWQVITEYSL